MTKKNKTLMRIVVSMLILGVVSMYAPLLFSRPQVVPEEQSDQSATLNQQAPLANDVATSSTSTIPSTEGFNGLNEEQKSLNNLGN